MDYIQTKPKKYNRLKIKGVSKMQIIKVNTKHSKAKAQLKTAKIEHRKGIKSERATIKASKRAIKQHKLLIKQAKTIYKLERI